MPSRAKDVRCPRKSTSRASFLSIRVTVDPSSNRAYVAMDVAGPITQTGTIFSMPPTLSPSQSALSTEEEVASPALALLLSGLVSFLTLSLCRSTWCGRPQRAHFGLLHTSPCETVVAETRFWHPREPLRYRLVLEITTIL